MKKGRYDISLIDTENFHVEGALKVTFIKSKKLFEIILAIIAVALLLVVAINNSFYGFIIFLGLLFIPIIYEIKEYKNLAGESFYLSIDEEGVLFENEKYLWVDIDGVEYERYLANNWREFIHVSLKNGTSFKISLFPTPLSAEIEEIAAYIKKYWNPGLQQ